MTGFLLDTNVLSELTRPKPDCRVENWLDEANDELLYLSVVSLGEILKGVTALPESKRRRQLQSWVVDTLRPWFAGRILPVNDHIAERWGILAGECRRNGRQLTMADGLIAPTAREHNLTVVTRNVRDFAEIGVDLLNPWAVAPPDMPKTQ